MGASRGKVPTPSAPTPPTSPTVPVVPAVPGVDADVAAKVEAVTGTPVEPTTAPTTEPTTEPAKEPTTTGTPVTPDAEPAPTPVVEDAPAVAARAAALAALQADGIVPADGGDENDVEDEAPQVEPTGKVCDWGGDTVGFVVRTRFMAIVGGMHRGAAKGDVVIGPREALERGVLHGDLAEDLVTRDEFEAELAVSAGVDLTDD